MRLVRAQKKPVRKRKPASFCFYRKSLRPTRLERATYGFEVRCSIQLSYERILGCLVGFEPTTTRSTIWRSTPELQAPYKYVPDNIRKPQAMSSNRFLRLLRPRHALLLWGTDTNPESLLCMLCSSRRVVYLR